jgi:hypothetical protein
MSKSCFVCHTNPTSQHECKKNHEGISDGMEGAGVVNIFNHSLHNRGICYTRYFGDTESRAYQRVAAGKPYDPNISVTKLEGVRHVQKIIGLRRLVKEKTGIKLRDSKLLGSKGCITQSEIQVD